MMWVKVVTAFRDKYTDERHPLDAVLNVTEERGQELIEAGVAVATKKPRKQKQA